MDKTNIYLLLVGALFLYSVSCFSHYRDRIPNGRNVKDPCMPNKIWNGVGHENPLGGGKNNQFGKDFKSAKKRWTRNLCFKDSDNDGRHNGLELGDPWCRWSPENNAKLLRVVSHPGVCDPLNSNRCLRNQQSSPCIRRKQLQCKVFIEPGIQKLDFVMPRTFVPAKETIFACMTFNLPRDQDYHIVAMKPIVHNRDVAHHMIVFGCNKDYDVTVSGRAFECGFMPPTLCDDPMLYVSAGYESTCLNENAGFLIGKSGYRQILLQIHWNNPDHIPNSIDNSGVTLYYTSNLRKYNAGVMSLIATEITIPPRKSAVTVETTCPGHCTSTQITSPVTIHQVLNHMHLLGRKQKIELIRNGKRVRYITNDESFNFLDPQIYTFKESVQVYPGDTLKTTCEYNSLNVSKTVNFGLATSDEMCVGMLTYYPKEAWKTKTCATYRDIPLCNIETTGKINDCDVSQFLQMAKTYRLFSPMLQKCAKSGKCSSACLTATTIARRHPCMKGIMYDMWKTFILQFEQRLVGVTSTDPLVGELFSAFVVCENKYDKLSSPRARQ